MNKINTIQSTIKYTHKGKKFETSLRKWFSKPIVFNEIDNATFTDSMVLGTIAFDKDNTISVLVPKNIFYKESR